MDVLVTSREAREAAVIARWGRGDGVADWVTTWIADGRLEWMKGDDFDVLDRIAVTIDLARAQPVAAELAPVALILFCPACGARHVDRGEFATQLHHTHACQKCGLAWRPAIVPTVGVQFLPGFHDAESGR